MPGWVQIDGVLVPKSEREPTPRHSRYKGIITDSHEPFRSMADGKIYDSKSAYRRSLKAYGYEETGNERPNLKPAPDPDPKEIERDVVETIKEMNHG